ncbi:MAG TPA: xanthine dehydrogenase family protein molybdopterin-binding subunit [Chloroflexota bacterium]|nr:xanthine dehydrogenase family protein molybdopterin-binding subunit [Chloroflexota bacterium]
MSYSVIGTPVTRVEAVGKVTGAERYAANVLLPGTLWGKALRSPHAHARIVRIDASRARQAPGVHAVLTAADIPDMLIGRRLHDVTVLARDRVRHIGEKVAVVAADEPDLAEAALELIQVEYEDLPAVFDPLEAMQAGSPILHPELRTYKNVTSVPDIPNVHSYRFWKVGDVEQGFAQAELIFEDTFSTPMQHHGYLEPHSCVVRIRDDGQIDVWSAGKQPFNMRRWIAEAADVDEQFVTVHPVAVGGDFGGKGYVVDEIAAYFLAKATGRPVRMIMTYAEELTAAVPRHASVITIKTGLMRDGRIVARQAKSVFNSGAFGGHKPNADSSLSGSEAACGVYRIPHTLNEAYCVYTNQVPCGHMRAPGWVQATFAVECHMDMLAERLGMDPVEFRLKNVVVPGDTAPTGVRWQNPRPKEALERAAALIGWNAPKPANTGRGVALSYEHIGTGKSGAILSVDEDGRFKLVVGVPEVGTGAHTMMRQLVAEILQVAPADVAVELGDTSSALFDSGSGGDRVTHVAGTAVQRVAQKMKGEIEGFAAEMPSAIQELGAGHVELTFRDLAARVARAQGGRVEVREEVDLQGHLAERNFIAHAVETEVDPETGHVRVKRVVSVQDVGTVLNPMLAQGQVEGGAITALGYAVMEDLAIEDGRVTMAHLGDYKLPCAADVPELISVFLDSDEGPAPFGSKPVGEVSIVGLAPAVVNSVYDASGVRIPELPVTAEKVFRGMKSEPV